MGYRSIAASLYAEGKATSMFLWTRIRSNFISHEDRILSLEANGGVILPGFIFEYTGAEAPSGYLLCDGSTKAQSLYPTLYALITNTYGSDAAGLFTLPDFRGATPIGIGTGSGLTPRSIGGTGGAATVALVEAELPSHTHTKTEGTHTHGGVINGFAASPPGGIYRHAVAAGNGFTTGTRLTDSATTGITLANSGSSTPHNNLQPSLVTSYIIKT